MDRKLDSFQGKWLDRKKHMIAIYDHPLDYPDTYVARLWIKKPLAATNIIVCSSELDSLRKDIQAAGFLERIDGKVEADPVILETWI